LCVVRRKHFYRPFGSFTEWEFMERADHRCFLSAHKTSW
jgi:hypothetical protein